MKQQSTLNRRSQPEQTEQQTLPNRVTNSKPIPHIPLPFKEVIADVLKVKPPQKKGKQKRKARANEKN